MYIPAFMKRSVMPLFFILTAFQVFAQQEKELPVFKRIMQELEGFKPDTSSPPMDRKTKKIIQLRKLRGGFNINEAVEFKLEEERQKKEKPAAEIDAMADFFRTGNGAVWLNNALVWIYRDHFSYKELKRMVRFYRSGAGQKLASDFPVIMLKALKAGDMIKDHLKK